MAQNNYNQNVVQFSNEVDNTKQLDNDPCAPGSTFNTPFRHDIMLINKHFKDINPIMCGEHFCEPGYSYGFKFRSYYLLHFIVSGKGTFISHGVSRNVSQGQIFVIRPEEITFYKADEVDPWHYRWMGFDSSLDLSKILADDVIRMPECENIFSNLMCCESIVNFSEYYICAKIYDLFSLIAQKSNMGHRKSYEYVLKGKNFIESNYANSNLTVQYIANNLNLDRSYFATIFKKYNGCSPQQYLVNFRLQKSAELISTEGYKPSEAAFACGYNNVFNFSKMFKSKFGVSPSGYAKIQE